MVASSTGIPNWEVSRKIVVAVARNGGTVCASQDDVGSQGVAGAVCSAIANAGEFPGSRVTTAVTMILLMSELKLNLLCRLRAGKSG